MQKIVASGKLETRDHGESMDVLFLGGHSDPLAEELEDIRRKFVTCRYWITDQETTRQAAQESFLRALVGVADVRFRAHYSEITGYLWTDEDLNIGGHDLLAELKSYAGKWLILEIDVQEG